jgi:hypothetical protein
MRKNSERHEMPVNAGADRRFPAILVASTASSFIALSQARLRATGGSKAK